MKQKEPVYGEVFLTKLQENLSQLHGKLDANTEGNLTKTTKNTCLFAKALQETFCDMGDVVTAMIMGASCDFTLTEKK